MLLVLLPIALLCVVAVVVAACLLAARADASASSPKPPSRPSDEDAPLFSLSGLTVWDCADPAQVRRLARDLAAPSSTSPAQRGRGLSSRPAAGGARARGVHGGARPLARAFRPS